MRTTAAEVLREHASLTRRWQNADHNLIRYITAFSRDVAEKHSTARAAMMFYPMKSERDSESWTRLIGKGLFTATTYQITDEMCHAVTAMYQKATENVIHIDENELPDESGFVWLDEPVLLKDRQSKLVATRAFSWEVTSVGYENTGTIPAMRVVQWADAFAHDDFSNNFTREMNKQSARRIGRLQLQHVAMLPLGRDLDADRSRSQSDNVGLWFHAMLMLLGSEITIQRRGFLPRGVITELKKTVKQPEVSVVTLRRVVPSPADDDHAHEVVDWSCRWLVQGHHRHLEGYDVAKHHAAPKSDDRGRCAICGKQITWIKPYVKGPDGLPIKNADVVYRLSRLR